MPTHPTPRDSREIRSWDLESDVIVVGLGCAGACAALEARREGADVLVLERASGGGGTSAMSGGVLYLGGGTSIQQACGFEDSAEEMFAYLMASSGAEPDSEKIRLYCEGSVDHFNWLVACGVPFKPVFHPHTSGEPANDDGLVFSGNERAHPYCDAARPAPRGHVPAIDGAAGGLLMRTLLAAVEGSAARILSDTRCTSLVQSPGGEIVGVMAQIEGEQRALRASQGVILTTGGFINNPEMIQEYLPLVSRCSFRVGAEGDDGSGIRMGMSAGGAAIHLDKASISLPIFPPKELARGILVNAHGKRFVNEDVYYGRLGELALFENDGRCYLVLDDSTFIRPEIPREVAGVGETPAELEKELGLPSGSLTATLREYNEHAETGRDPNFHKSVDYVTPLTRPPYGALDCTTEGSLYAAFTLGGLNTTAAGEVLDSGGEPIPGLYAAGRASSGISVGSYSSGLSLGDGSFFGRCAGRRAALNARLR